MMRLRARAIESGVDVQFVREKDSQGQTKFKYVPSSRIPWVEYRLTLSEVARQEWCYQAISNASRQEIFEWQVLPDNVLLPDSLTGCLVRFSQNWPARLPHLSVKRQGRSLWVTWDEQGELEQVDLIVGLLHEIAQCELKED